MADTAADVLLDTIHHFGTDVIFGRPGPGTEGLMAALSRRQGKLRFIQTQHEEGGAFMACVYAKFTGKLGVCLASGLGGARMLNGLYDACLDGVPVLALTGGRDREVIGAFGRQAVHLDRLLADVSIYNERLVAPEQAAKIAGVACRAAIRAAGVAHLHLPAGLQEQPAPAMPILGDGAQRDAPRLYKAWGGLPPEASLLQAAQVLNAGKRVTLLVGRGALDATDLLEALADKLAAPIVKALLGKSAVPDDSPYCTGGIGLVGTRPSQEAMETCDTIFLIGTSFPYMEFLPRPGQARGVQIDIDPTRIGLRYPVEVGLIGDTRRVLERLLPMLDRKKDRSFLDKAQKGMTEWWQLMMERGTSRAMPMKPQVVAWELGQRLADDAIISCDSGTIATWFSRQVPARRGQKSSLSGLLATMANGLPYAIAAQVAFPQRQCVAYVGDGGFSMLMGEFLTAVRYNLPIKVVINKNNVLGQIKWEQMVFLGNPEFGVQLQPIDFAGFARSCGAQGFTIEDPARCGQVLDQALSTPGPVVIEAVVDPDTPPLPAKIKPSQALHFAESLARGEPHPLRIALTATGDKVKEMI